jgi:hypothetical protein
MNLGELRDEIEHYRKALRKIADMKPVGAAPTWNGAHDDCETNGYDLAAWDAASIAEEALK